jgi:hypothetical protein
MSGSSRVVLTGAAAAAALTLAGCADVFSSADTNTLAVASAFQSVPVGFSANASSFDAGGDVGPFFPGPLGGPRDGGMGGSSNVHAAHPGPGGRPPKGPGDGDRRDGFGGPGLRGMLMGGGLHSDFLGVIPAGKGFGHGPFRFFRLPDACTFDSTSARVTCPDRTQGGLTITSSYAFKDTEGVAQPRFDTTSTDYVNARIGVSGTRTRKDSSTSTVSHRSDRTVTGFAPGSTARTVNGTASGTETTAGVRDSVAFTAVRSVSDTTTGLVIPIQTGHPAIPTAGVVIRNMKVTITPAGGTATSKSRREKITFDGTNVVQVEITQDGVTRTCTITLPSRKLVCD